MNIGFYEALHHSKFDCFVFHDVDLLPEDDRNSYSCPEEGFPRHLSVAINTFGYRYMSGLIKTLKNWVIMKHHHNSKKANRSESFWRSKFFIDG